MPDEISDFVKFVSSCLFEANGCYGRGNISFMENLFDIYNICD